MKLNRRLGVSTAGILETYLGDYRGRNGTQTVGLDLSLLC